MSNEATGVGPVKQGLDVGTRDEFNVNCSLSSVGNVSNQFLSEREEMSVDFRYKEDGLSFWKPAEIDIII